MKYIFGIREDRLREILMFAVVVGLLNALIHSPFDIIQWGTLIFPLLFIIHFIASFLGALVGFGILALIVWRYID